MGDDFVIVPSDGDGYVELARTRSGRLFKKHLLNLGELRHPTTGSKINIDKKFFDTMKKNFDDRVCDIVQVPLANDKNEHTENPERNIGEVIDLRLEGKKVYAVLDVRDPSHAEKLGKTYLGASAMMHLDYTNTKTGEKVGPTLLHSCVTNRPYVTGLDDYKEIVAATDKAEDAAVILLSDDTLVVEKPAEVEPTNQEPEMPDDQNTETPVKPTLDELLTALKSDHNIDVSALQAQATDTAKQTELSQTLIDALTKAGVVKLSNTDSQDDVSNDTVIAAVQELATNNVTLTSRLTSLERKDAEHAVDALISEGRVLPAQKEAFVELKLSNTDMFGKLVPANPIVKLNNEKGVTPAEDEAHKKNIDDEISRYVKLANGVSA